MEKAEAAYKRDFDARLPGSLPANIKSEDYAFVRQKYYNPQVERRHKISPVAEGRFRVVSVTPDKASSMLPHKTSAYLATVLSWPHQPHSRHGQVLILKSLMP